MSTLRALMAAATLTATHGVATAAPAVERMSDGHFLQLNRCAGLLSAQPLGGDGKAVDAAIREQSRGRDPYIMQRADDLRDQAARDARHASAERSVKLIAERDRVCRRLVPDAGPVAAAHATTPGATSPTN